MDIQPATSLPRLQGRTQFTFRIPTSFNFNLFTDTPIHAVPVFLKPVILMPDTPTYAALVWLTPVLTLVGIKYQGKTLTAFETHPVTIMVSVISLLVYYCLAIVPRQALVSTEVCNRLMTFSVSLSLVTLASLILPEPLLIALYAIYCLILVAESYSYGTFHKLYRWVRRIVAKLVNGPARNRSLLPVHNGNVN